MSFSPEWDHIYQQNAHLSVWPWSDLVTFVMRHVRPRAAGLRVLEVGVGAGANVPFFHALGADYFGIDGSATVVAKLRERFPNHADHFIVADFTKELPAPGPFDLIVDRGAVTCNTEAGIRACLALVRNALKPGGHFIGVDWFSNEHSSAALGDADQDIRTRTNIAEGHLVGLGRIHFSDAAHLRSLFSDFEIDVLEHKKVERVIPAKCDALAWYHVVCRKPALRA